MRIGRMVALVIALVVAMPCASLAQHSVPYIAALRLYESGSFDEAIVAVNDLSDTTVLSCIEVLRREMKGEVHDPEFNMREARRLMQVALVLHTDAASRARLASVLPEIASGPGSFYKWHDSVSRRLVRLLEQVTTDLALIRNWYKFLLARHQTYYSLEDADRLAAAAPKLVFDDPEVMLARAAVHETAWRRRHEDDDDLGLDGELDAAERWLRAAVLARPALDEARLRLGRVQTMRGEWKDALVTLRGVPGDAEAGFAYLAKLFEGDVLERLGDREGARTAYQAANGIMPSARSARTALAHLLHTGGDRRQAADMVGVILREPESPALEEPWLVYSVGTAWRAPDYLDALRKAVMTK